MGEQDTAGRSGGRLAWGAAVAGGTVTAFGALALGVLAGQALIARRAIPGAEAPPPRCSGDYAAAEGCSGPALRLALIGDSTAAGYGVHTVAETPGALLAGWISQATGRPVHLCCPAVVGAVSAMLPPQVETAIEEGVDLGIVLIGANDVTAQSSQAPAVGHLYRAVRHLVAAGAQVVVATCPDLGTIAPIRPPLRWLARQWSRRLAAAQTIATIEAGGRTVSLGDLLGPEFSAAPDRMFGADRFHPSAEGYRLAAAAILPTALAAIGLPVPDHGAVLTPTAQSLPAAAVAAVDHAGTEVSGVRVTGRAGGLRSEGDGGPAMAERLRAVVARLDRLRHALRAPESAGRAAPTSVDAVPSRARRSRGARTADTLSTVDALATEGGAAT
jgi:lysophospholipase L1-like esterase